MSTWKHVGMTYLKYADLCATHVRNALKEPMKTKSKELSSMRARVTKWEAGKKQTPGACPLDPHGQRRACGARWAARLLASAVSVGLCTAHALPTCRAGIDAQWRPLPSRRAATSLRAATRALRSCRTTTRRPAGSVATAAPPPAPPRHGGSAGPARGRRSRAQRARLGCAPPQSWSAPRPCPCRCRCRRRHRHRRLRRPRGSWRSASL